MPTAKTLVVGATNNPSRYAYIATNMLLEYGHEVLLFGIKKGEIAGIPIQHEWPQEEVDTITLYISKKWQDQYYSHILESGARRIIFNPGTENDELVSMARSKGIQCQEACTLVLLRTNQY